MKSASCFIASLIFFATEAYELFPDELKYRASADLDFLQNNRSKVIGQKCWNEFLTEPACCTLRENNLDKDGNFRSFGDISCWEGKYDFMGCCLVENTCEGTVFQQFFKLVPKVLLYEPLTVFEIALLRAIVEIHMFSRAEHFLLCPTAGLIASLLSTLKPFVGDDSTIDFFNFVHDAKIQNGVARDWAWELWGLWESVTLLSGQHNYNLSPVEHPDIVRGGHTPSTAKFHLPHAPGRDLYKERLKADGVGLEVTSALSKFSTRIATAIDNFVVTQAFSIPHFFHTIDGPFAVQKMFPSIHEQNQAERNFVENSLVNPVYVGDNTFQAFGQGAADGVLVTLFDKYLGVGDYPWFLEIGTQYGGECNTRFFRVARGWDGVMLDRIFENPYIRLHRLHVTAENIIPALDGRGVPRKIDLLSIDIDGMDRYIFEAIAERVQARVVIIEVAIKAHLVRNERNATTQYESFAPEYKADHVWMDGPTPATDPRTMAQVAAKYGYVPVALLWNDMIFVKREELEVVTARTGIRFETDLSEIERRDAESDSARHSIAHGIKFVAGDVKNILSDAAAENAFMRQKFGQQGAAAAVTN